MLQWQKKQTDFSSIFYMSIYIFFYIFFYKVFFFFLSFILTSQNSNRGYKRDLTAHLNKAQHDAIASIV